MPGGETTKESVGNALLTTDGCLQEAMVLLLLPSSFGEEQDGFWSLSE